MSTIKIDENAINNIVKSPKQRKVIYSIYAVLGIAIGSIQVGVNTAGLNSLPWLEVATSIYIYLSVPFGVLALTNAPSENSIKEESKEVFDEQEDEEVVEDSGFYYDENGQKVYEIK